MRYIAAVDLGTTAIKVMLFDETGLSVAEASEETRLTVPAPGLAEQDPAAWFETPLLLLRRVLQSVPAREVLALGVSSQGISFVPVDAENRPLRAAISWLDMRAEAELDGLLARVSAEELFRVTGKPATPAYTLPKLLWLRAHEREAFERADAFLLPMDYFLARLTGARVTDPTMAGGTMLYDLGERRWSDSLLEIAGLPPRKLAKVAPSGTNLGAARAECGLPSGMAVFTGAQDQKIAAFGARIDEQTVTLSLGTAAALEAICPGRSALLPAFPYVDGERTLLEGCVNTGGAAIRWAREVLLGGDSYERFNALAQAAPPGAHGVRFRPHLSGAGTAHSRTDLQGSFEGLTLASDLGDLLRAVYEGVAFELKLNLDEALHAGADARRVRAFGGGAKSPVLLQILADTLGLPVLTQDCAETALLGAARMAARGAGLDAEAFGRDEHARAYKPYEIVGASHASSACISGRYTRR